MTFRVSVVIPVYNGSATLAKSLSALAASTRSPDEIIVVDDSSTDDSAAVARQCGAHVLPLSSGPCGPAAARNRGVEQAQGDVLVFVDADKAVHPDTLALIERHLTENPGYSAFFGSYDTAPPVPTLVSRYKNLMHHYVHQHGSPEASTFWSGCGAIYRETFLQMGGFDEDFITIEDIELGVRLKKAGHRIRLCHDIQVTHLKHWTFTSLLREDILRRAVPWTHLIHREGRLPADLNVDTNSRLGAAAAWLGLLCVLGGFWLPWLWAGALLAVAALAVLNLELYRFFAQHGGWSFALGAAGLHILYLLYSSLTFVMVTSWDRLAKRPSRSRL